MRAGRPDRFRTNPPACALPDAENIALSCAVHDISRSPGYRPYPDEWEQSPKGYEPTPTPEYRARNESCRYTNADLSAAECTLELSRPADEGAFRPITVLMTHKFHAEHGPASHYYIADWYLDGDCGENPYASR